MDNLYCINRNCPYKSKCKKALIMNKEWFFSHLDELEKGEILVEWSNRESNTKCDVFEAIDHE